MEVLSVIDGITTGMQLIVLWCQGWLLQYFCGSFLKYRFAPAKWKGLMIALLYGVLAFGVDYLLPTEYGVVRILGKKGLTLVVITLLAVGFYEAGRRITAFLIVTFMAVSDVCFFIAYMIMQMGSRLTEYMVELFDKGYFSTEETFLSAVEIVLTVLLFLMYVVFMGLSFIFLRKIIKCFREKEEPMGRKEVLFLMAPGITGLLLCVLLRMIMITVEDGRPKLLYDKYPALMVLVPVIMLFSLLSIWYSVKLFQDMVDLHRERSCRIIMEKQIAGMQKQVKEVERIYSGMRSMKHDMRNTLAVIMQLAEKGAENEELQVYLAEVNNGFDQLESRFKTGNTVADTLLNMKYHEVVQVIPEIVFCADALILPDDLQIQSYDIGVILGNALDNAVEACRKYKQEKAGNEVFIRVSSFRKGKMFFVEVENSCCGMVIRRDFAELPVTDKKDKNVHGIGLLNIKNTAEKYHGSVDYTVNGGKFTLTVMMQNGKERK